MDAAIDFVSLPSNWARFLPDKTSVIVHSDTHFEVLPGLLSGGRFSTHFWDVEVDRARSTEQMRMTGGLGYGDAALMTVKPIYSFAANGEGRCTMRRVVNEYHQHRFLCLPLLPVVAPLIRAEPKKMVELLNEEHHRGR